MKKIIADALYNNKAIEESIYGIAFKRVLLFGLEDIKEECNDFANINSYKQLYSRLCLDSRLREKLLPYLEEYCFYFNDITDHIAESVSFLRYELKEFILIMNKEKII